VVHFTTYSIIVVSQDYFAE